MRRPGSQAWEAGLVSGPECIIFRRMRSLVFLGVLLTLVLAQERGVNAHPHVFITNTSTLILEDGKIVAVRHRWSFDGFFTALIRTEFDPNKDGHLDPEEIKVIRAEAFSNLKEFNYFTWTLVKGKPAQFTPDDILDFTAELDKRAVHYTFTLKLPEPIDPGLFSMSVRDETFYIDVQLAEKDPIAFEGTGAERCFTNIDEDPTNPIYFGLVFPTRVDLLCRTS